MATWVGQRVRVTKDFIGGILRQGETGTITELPRLIGSGPVLRMDDGREVRLGAGHVLAAGPGCFEDIGIRPRSGQGRERTR